MDALGPAESDLEKSAGRLVFNGAVMSLLAGVCTDPEPRLVSGRMDGDTAVVLLTGVSGGVDTLARNEADPVGTASGTFIVDGITILLFSGLLGVIDALSSAEIEPRKPGTGRIDVDGVFVLLISGILVETEALAPTPDDSTGIDSVVADFDAPSATTDTEVVLDDALGIGVLVGMTFAFKVLTSEKLCRVLVGWGGWESASGWLLLLLCAATPSEKGSLDGEAVMLAPSG